MKSIFSMDKPRSRMWTSRHWEGPQTYTKSVIFSTCLWPYSTYGIHSNFSTSRWACSLTITAWVCS